MEICSVTQKGVVQRYFSQTAGKYSYVFHTSASFQERFGIVKEFVSDLNPKVAWDLGCGTGDYLNLLTFFCKDVYAVDFSPEMISIAKTKVSPKKKNIHFLCNDIDSLNPNQMSADLLLVMGVIEYIQNPKSFLIRLRKMCVSEGILILSFPNLWAPSRLMDRFLSRPWEWMLRKLQLPIPEHVRRRKPMSYTFTGYIRHLEFSLKKIKHLLSEADFEIICFKDYNLPKTWPFFQLSKAISIVRQKSCLLLGSGIVVKAKAI